MAVCKQFGADVPVLIARDQVDEDIIASAMQQGARDVVTLKNPLRLRRSSRASSKRTTAHKR